MKKRTVEQSQRKISLSWRNSGDYAIGLGASGDCCWRDHIWERGVEEESTGKYS